MRSDPNELAERRQAMAAAVVVRRGVVGIGRRLRLERSGSSSLTTLELSLLGHLHRRGPLTPGDLAAAERVQPQSLTRTLASLAEDGLILRRPDPDDGRRSRLGITDPGLTALRAEMGQRDRWLAEAMSRELTSTEIELLRLAGELLDRLADTAS
jgi:DNA-binding MarR family transcriptional regulator